MTLTKHGPKDALWSSTAARGAASELYAAAHLMKQGYYVYRCESPAAPFDLVAYRDGEMIRVEIKSVTCQKHVGETYAPSYTWPRNDEWDLLIYVGEANQCIEIRTHDRREGIDRVRAAYGFPPAPLRAVKFHGRASSQAST